MGSKVRPGWGLVGCRGRLWLGVVLPVGRKGAGIARFGGQAASAAGSKAKVLRVNHHAKEGAQKPAAWRLVRNAHCEGVFACRAKEVPRFRYRCQRRRHLFEHVRRSARALRGSGRRQVATRQNRSGSATFSASSWKSASFAPSAGSGRTPALPEFAVICGAVCPLEAGNVSGSFTAAGCNT